MTCENCGDPRIRAKGRCAACLEYRRLHGQERPEELVVAAGRRQVEREHLSKMVRAVLARIPPV